MHVSVHLHGILRDRLPPAARGRTTLELPDAATVGDLLATLGIERRVIVSINGRTHVSTGHVLREGDQVMIYTPVGGG
ncbi:MAG: molybdopterin synthase sulfur carrier subunit [Ardenticatenia bacterium]|jgi:sulfur carrier protein ThiS|nr:MAG: molybdopterin synthase sulfur carrier subunit [Ardenticatenia bacterium]